MLGFLDPLVPMGDQYQISPPIIHKGIISWSNTNFSALTS